MNERIDRQENAPESPDPNAALDGLLARYIAAVDAGHDPGLEALCEEHPELASDLRRHVRGYHDLNAAVHADRPGRDASEPPPTSEATTTWGRSGQTTEFPGDTARRPHAPPTREGSQSLDDDRLLRGLPDEDGGKRLGPCVLTKRLGAGGFGNVYRGTHRGFGFDVAVKCLHPHLAEHGLRLIERFRKEARITVRLSHENLIRLHHIDEDQGIHYLVMEFIEGETVRQRTQRKVRLKSGEALQIAIAAAKGLGAMHAAGVVHRDVKPENILIGHDGRVKVADLGLAKDAALSSTMTETGEVFGTPRFMAPEQFHDSKRVLPAADVYSLGATLYFMLVGECGIGREATTPYDVAREVTERGHPSIRQALPGLNPPLAKVIDRAVHIDPNVRYADANALAAALIAVRTERDRDLSFSTQSANRNVDHSDGFVSPPPVRHAILEVMTQSRAIQWARRHIAWTTIAGLLALGLIGFSIAHLYPTQAEQDPKTPVKVVSHATGDPRTPGSATPGQEERGLQEPPRPSEKGPPGPGRPEGAAPDLSSMVAALDAGDLAVAATITETILEQGAPGAVKTAAEAFERLARARWERAELAEAILSVNRARELEDSEARAALRGELNAAMSAWLSRSYSVVPAPQTWMRDRRVTVEVWVAEPGTTTVRVGGMELVRDGDRYRREFHLDREGSHDLPIQLTRSGVTFESDYRVFVKTTTPRMEVPLPPALKVGVIVHEDGSNRYRSQVGANVDHDHWHATVPIEGTLHGGPATIQIGEERLPVDAEGRFRINATPTPDESLILVAIDPAGRRIEHEVPIGARATALRGLVLRGADAEGRSIYVADVARKALGERAIELVEVRPGGTKPAYFIGRFEITRAQWFAVWNEIHPGGSAPGSTERDLPVVSVSWRDASSFCAAIGAVLPTTEQWQLAAAGPDGWTYATGAAPTSLSCVFRDEAPLDRPEAAYTNETTAPPPLAPSRVTPRFPPGPWGTYHQAGNVQEWLRDPLRPGQYQAAGGSNTSRDTSYVTVTTIDYLDGSGLDNTGFRPCFMPASQ